MTDDTIRDIVVASLEPRARPAMDADFINLLADYGGDPLTRAYLDMDVKTSHLPAAPMSEGAIRRFAARRAAVSEMVDAINEALAASEAGEDRNGTAPSAGESGITETDIPGDYNNTGPVVAAAGMSAAPLAAGAANGGAAGSVAAVPATGSDGAAAFGEAGDFPAAREAAFDGASPGVSPGASPGGKRSMRAASDFAVNDDGTLAMESAGSSLSFENPRGSADLKRSSRIPEKSGESGNGRDDSEVAGKKATPYPVREPSEDHTFYMGSYETTAPDGHGAIVHRNSRSGYLGSSVESTSSGHKVQRYFSGKTESAVPGRRGSDAPKRGNSLGGTPVKAEDFLP
ncbi:MAG: hypothetical protein LBF41_03300 [Deltaproteobacteria bacterium]|nr:hypothetical protein [Deltaproteobacteria bacterium]